MLVFISDLHFRDEALWTVKPNMTAGFLKKTLIPQVYDAMRDVPAGDRILTVVFLGDLVDVNRSPFWVEGRSQFTPWSHWRDALAHVPGHATDVASEFDRVGFERAVVTVLDRIAAANRDNYTLWRRFKAKDGDLWGDGPAPDRIRYEFIPGNHDRLANYSPATRCALTRDLGLDWNADDPFPWAKGYPEYSVVAFHGHVLDAPNFGGKNVAPRDYANDPWYEVPSLGDAITVMFGVGLVHEIRTKLSLPADDPHVRSLGQIDLVRPQAAAFRWLLQWGLDQKLKRALDQVVVTLLDRFLADGFVKWQLDLPWYAKLLLSLGIGKPHDVESAFKFFEKRATEKSVEDYTRTMLAGVTSGALAAWIKATYPRLRFSVSGHTHRPFVHAVAGGTGDIPDRERVYFNSGTWLDVMEEGSAGGFARRGQVVHVAFYSEQEDHKADGRRSLWEYWQGNLREGPVNP